MSSFKLQSALPRYRAYAALRNQIVAYLQAEGARPGEPLFSVRQLVDSTGLSHVTVCRALSELQREGWIEQRVGQGTFVGPRVETPVLPCRRNGRGVNLTRVAVMTRRGLSVRFWFLHELLDGLESAAHENAVAVELLTHDDEDPALTRRRLAGTRPDVLVSVIPDAEQMRMVGEAERLGIPCIAAGMRCPEVRLPTVHEDSAQGAELAVEHLLRQGHRRIGFIAQSGLREWYMADRIEGYWRALVRAGIAMDANWVRETPMTPNAPRHIDFLQYVEANRLTAVVVGSSWLLGEVQTAMVEGWLQVPRDLSVIVFDQAPETHERMGMRLTHIAQPLREEGRRIAELAPRLARGEKIAEEVVLPCALVEGESVARPRVAARRAPQRK